MKRTHAIRSLIMSTTLCGAQILLLLSPLHAYADFGLPKTSPYTFGPEGRALQDLVDFATPIKMVDFPAHQPVQSTDQYGNKLFYNTAGKLIMSVSVDGSMVTYTAKGTRSFDADGKLVEETEVLEGTNRSVTRNEHGEVTGYSTRAFGNKLSQEFDADGNLLRTYGYADYAKSPAWVLNELSQTKTIHNDFNQAEKDVDFEGSTIATYQYDERGKLISKTDVYNNVTSFDEFGRMSHTTNAKGERIMAYEYRYDEKGNNILEKAIDESPGIYGGDVTTFHNNMQVETKSKFGGTATKYQYRGHTLVYTFDTRTNEVTWYNKYGQQTMSTIDGEIIRQHLHFKSRYVGLIDLRANRVVLYQYERQDQEVKFFRAADMPTADEIEKYYEVLVKMNDIIPTDENPVKQPEAIVRQNAIPLDGPAPIPARVMALTTGKSDASFAEQAKNTIAKKQFHYDDGKLLSIVEQNIADASGLTTKVFIGDSVFTTTQDMSAKAAAYADIWNAVMSGKSLADITSGTGEMAELARTIKSLDVPGDKIPGLSDVQLCNLLGWDIQAVNTAACLRDIRTRNENAGKHGNVTITYGYGYEGDSTRIAAAAVAAVNADGMTVGGLHANKLLDVMTTDARASVTDRTVKEGYVASLFAEDHTYNPPDSDPAPTLPQGAAFVQTINEVTRGYASNGNILYENDGQTHNTTVFDAYTRPVAVYGTRNQLMEKYSYGTDGRIESAFKRGLEANEVDQTSFYVGFGVANEDQAVITVFGDQTKKSAIVQKLFDALSAGQSIADMDPELVAFTQTIRSVSIQAATFAKMNDAALCSILGWDITAPDTAQCLAAARAIAEESGFEGKIALSYGDEPVHYAAAISGLNAGDTPTSTLDVTGYMVTAAPSAVEAAGKNLIDSMGYGLMESLGRYIGSIAHYMM